LQALTQQRRCGRRTSSAEGASTLMGESDGTAAEDQLSPAQQLQRDGYLIIRGFASLEECAAMRNAMATLLAEWEPPAAATVFKTDKEQEGAQGEADYFLSSGDKVRFFLEPAALDPSTGGLRVDVPKHEAVNKVGHALHVLDPTFAAYTQSDKVRRLVSSIGLRSPSLVQSMYIFKQPRIGDKVTPHQDSTFLRTEPLSCIGLWLALQRAHEHNGCLWARPGSHTEGLRRHFARRHKDGDAAQVHTVFVPVDETPCAASAWEGEMPAGVRCPSELGFVPLPAEEGDLVVIHGQLDHLSMPNTSEESRHTFQLHLVEGADANVHWCEDNWLQYPAGKPFPSFDRPLSG